MGVHNLPHITDELTTAGLSADTPIALIRWGTRPDQQELLGTLGSIVQQVEETGFEAPAVAVVGAVVNYRHRLQEILGDAVTQRPIVGQSL